MTYISSLQNIHKHGTFGDYENKNENELLKLKEVKKRAVDFIAGGTYAIDGHQERVGESIFLFAPSCVNVTSSSSEEASPSSVATENTPQYSLGKNTAPEPAWVNSKLSNYS